MTLQTPAPREPSKPKSSQFIIALFLAKSKPRGLSVQEYILSVRNCVKQGRRLGGLPSAHNHIDTTAFWRDAFKKSEEAQNELRAKVFELERKLEVRGDPRSVTPASQMKRNRCPENTEEHCSTTSPKRPRLAVNESILDGDDGSLEAIADDAMKISSDRKACVFLHHLYIFRQLMAENNSESKALATITCQVLSGIRQVILSIESTHDSESTNSTASRKAATRTQQRSTRDIQSREEAQLNTKLLAIARIFPYLLRTLHRLEQSADGELHHSQVIYSCIETFRDLLQQICTLSIAKEHKRLAPPTSHKAWKSHIGLSKKSVLTHSPSHNSSKMDGGILKLCSLLLTLTANLDKNNATDTAILEGFLFFLLNRVGTALKIFVFENDYPEDFLGHPGSGSPITAIHPDYDEDQRNAKAQAPYLVYLLDRLIPLAAQRTHLSTDASSSSTANPSLTTPRHTLTKIPSTALQNTLLHAVFGASTEAADFSEALTIPLPPEEIPFSESADKVLGKEGEDRGVGDWFKMEVWRVVGWDVLGGCIGW